MKKILPFIFAVMLSGCNTSTTSPDESIPLYPNGATKNNNSPQEEQIDENSFVTYVSEARMYPYIVPKEKSSGAAVLICPGGGYWGLSVEKEGVELAQLLNGHGISAFVLYYRMPFGNSDIPLEDAKAAMKIIRKNAKKWNINPNKIGIAGFSAGGHLASTLGTHFSPEDKPDFMILAYPVISMKNGITHTGSRNNLLGENPNEALIDCYSNELHVNENTPQAFIIHAKDDGAVSIENSYLFYNALTDKNIQVELCEFEKGGHGFGLREQGTDSDKWPEYLITWLENNNLTAKQ